MASLTSRKKISEDFVKKLGADQSRSDAGSPAGEGRHGKPAGEYTRANGRSGSGLRCVWARVLVLAACAAPRRSAI